MMPTSKQSAEDLAIIAQRLTDEARDLSRTANALQSRADCKLALAQIYQRAADQLRSPVNA